MLALVIAALIQTATPPPQADPPQADPEDKAVMAVTQAFLDGLGAADTEALKPLFLPGAQFMGVRSLAGGQFKLGRVAFEDSYGKHLDPGVKEC